MDKLQNEHTWITVNGQMIDLKSMWLLKLIRTQDAILKNDVVNAVTPFLFRNAIANAINAKLDVAVSGIVNAECS